MVKNILLYILGTLFFSIAVLLLSYFTINLISFYEHPTVLLLVHYSPTVILCIVSLYVIVYRNTFFKGVVEKFIIIVFLSLCVVVLSWWATTMSSLEDSIAIFFEGHTHRTEVDVSRDIVRMSSEDKAYLYSWDSTSEAHSYTFRAPEGGENTLKKDVTTIDRHIGEKESIFGIFFIELQHHLLDNTFNSPVPINVLFLLLAIAYILVIASSLQIANRVLQVIFIINAYFILNVLLNFFIQYISVIIGISIASILGVVLFFIFYKPYVKDRHSNMGENK